MKKVIFFLLVSSFLVVACNSDKKNESSEKKESMSSDNKEAMTSTTNNKAEKNRQTALASVMAVNSHDADAVLKDAAPDCIDNNDGSMPPTKGTDSIKAGIKMWFAAFPDVKGENLMALSDADGSHVIVVGEWTGTFKGDLMGMKATNKSFKYWDGDLFTFNSDGKVTSHRSVQSSVTAMTQVGAKMPK
jgi:predicted ester cyclase